MPSRSVEQALDPVERDREEGHHRQRLREAEAQLRGGEDAVVEEPAVQRERREDRGALPGRAGRRSRCPRRAAPARVPEVPRQPHVRGARDDVNYNVGHLFSLSPHARYPDRRASPRSSSTIRGEARLTEANIQDALREVRVALLEADVALPVVKHFIDAVRAKALGEEVDRQPDAGTGAGRRGAPRARRADGRGERRPRSRRAAAGGDPDGRPAGLGQDHHQSASSRCCSSDEKKKVGLVSAATSIARRRSSS